jgi:hypothetical protein
VGGVHAEGRKGLDCGVTPLPATTNPRRKRAKKFAVDGAANTVPAMKRGLQMLSAVAVLGLVAFLAMRAWRAGEAQTTGAAEAKYFPEKKENQKWLNEAKPFSTPATATPGARAGLSADKLERLAKIRRDYDEIRMKMSAEFAAAGDKYPGGLNAFLKQLALLEREMHADFAAALTPAELEDYEMAESTTGKALAGRFGAVATSEEQRRTLFRWQKEFDDRFALVFDVTPMALVERVKVQQAMREKVRAMLGDEDYAKWLQAEDASYAGMRTLALQQGLSTKAVSELWRAKDEWTQRKLEIAAQPGLTPEQRAAMHASLAQQTRARVSALLGVDILSAGHEALVWLPPSR